MSSATGGMCRRQSKNQAAEDCGSDFGLLFLAVASSSRPLGYLGGMCRRQSKNQAAEDCGSDFGLLFLAVASSSRPLGYLGVHWRYSAQLSRERANSIRSLAATNKGPDIDRTVLQRVPD